MSLDNGFLTSDDITQIVPRNLIMHVIRGVMRQYRLTIGVMLDKDEDDTALCRGTGKEWISDDRPGAHAEYCRMLRSWPNEAVNTRCGTCDRNHFDDAKDRTTSDPGYKGEVYECSAGCLQDFVVPIVEKESGTFIGAIFGGQKRPKESFLSAWRRLRDFISKPENSALRLISFWKLLWNYLKVEKVTEKEFRNLKSVCEQVAEELAQPIAFFVRIRKEEYEKQVERDAIGTIDSVLNNATDLKALSRSMGGILVELQKWLQFDWGVVLKEEPKMAPGGFGVQEVTGRGIGPHDLVRRERFTLGSEEYEGEGMKMIQHNPSFLNHWMSSTVAGEPECWWIPFVRGDRSILGGIALGSAPEHRNTQYDPQRIRQWTHRLEEVAGKIVTKYSELAALEKERWKTKELERIQRQLKENVLALEHTLLGLTHHIGRPMVMMQAALSNVRDLKSRKLNRQIVKRIDRHVELGILAARHAKLLNRGLMRVFSAGLGGEFTVNTPIPIDVKPRLEQLCAAMHRLSGRRDLRFRFFQSSPTIRMDPDSFLYVFYALVDNAIKYSDRGRTIELVCDEERSRQTYAIKVKSFGLPIDDPGVVFQQFKRGRNAWRYDDTGVGLGCWSAREHMQRQGGDIVLETEGKLSVFIVHLPPQDR